jgi:DNA-binding CsgD family transcriptional regulator
MQTPERAELPNLGATPSYSFSLAPELAEHKSGLRLKLEPVAARYRLRWAYQELEVPAGTEFSVGRAPECLLRLGSTLVSRHHARFSYGDEGPMIEDLGSLNGVTVNQTRITAPTRLRHGDVIGIGDEQLKLVDVDVVETSARQSTLRVGPRSSGADGSRANHPPSLSALTERERNVFALLVQGHSSHEIAERLRLSPRTVERHHKRIAKRLNCATRGELVTYAICAGLLRQL